MTKRSLRRPKPARREDPRDRRAMPAIFVATPGEAPFGLGKHAQAHIRTRRGGYRYLVWREGGQVRELYLGKVRNSRPTPASRSGTSSPATSPRSAARPVGQRKRGRK